MVNDSIKIPINALRVTTDYFQNQIEERGDDTNDGNLQIIADQISKSTTSFPGKFHFACARHVRRNKITRMKKEGRNIRGDTEFARQLIFALH